MPLNSCNIDMCGSRNAGRFVKPLKSLLLFLVQPLSSLRLASHEYYQLANTQI